MIAAKNPALPSHSSSFRTLLQKLDTAFSSPEQVTKFSAAEAARAGAFEEDAISEQDVRESANGQ